MTQQGLEFRSPDSLPPEGHDCGGGGQMDCRPRVRKSPVPALALPYSPQSGTCALWSDSQSGWVWKSEGRKDLPSFPTPGAASSKHETVLGSRPQNHSALETRSKPVPREQEGEAGLGRCGWREGGVKRLREDRPEVWGGMHAHPATPPCSFYLLRKDACHWGKRKKSRASVGP